MSTRTDFSAAPAKVIWETTRASGATPGRDPGELSTIEAMLLMNRLRAFGRPELILAGGDPSRRPDLEELVRHARRLTLPVALTAPDRLDPDRIRRLVGSGLERLIVPLDASTTPLRDASPTTVGSFPSAIRTMEAARGLGLEVRALTYVTPDRRSDLEALRDLLAELRASRWWIRLPVRDGGPGGVAEFEGTLEVIADLAAEAPFPVETIDAPQYRRILLQRGAGDGERILSPGAWTNDGDGIVFVGRTGEIQPARRLAVSAGNVRNHDIVAIYREAPLFRALRDRDRLEGKCRACEFRAACGGSRTRAWAATGDALATDPRCPHVPSRRAARSVDSRLSR